MHCELVVPGLFAAPAQRRLPAVELLLARGRCTSAGSQPLERWLHDAFELGDEPLAAGAFSLLAANGAPDGYCWVRADPSHLGFMRERLILVPSAALGVKREEADALCSALNAHFGERLVVQVIDAERWVARFGEECSIDAQPPLEFAGRDVGLGLPEGAGASHSHRLLNESQMVLHGHPVNAAREARGEPAINSVWLWGAGRLPAVRCTRWHSVSADDPLALGLARAAGMRQRPLPQNAMAWLDRAPEDGRHLAVLDSLRVRLALSQTAEYEEALAALERDWFAPLLGALRAGQIGMVTIHVPDAAQCLSYEAIRGDLRRFWRRPKALEHYT